MQTQIYKLAKLLVEGAKHNSSNPLKIKVKKLFIASRGFTANKGKPKHKVAIN